MHDKLHNIIFITLYMSIAFSTIMQPSTRLGIIFVVCVNYNYECPTDILIKTCVKELPRRARLARLAVAMAKRAGRQGYRIVNNPDKCDAKILVEPALPAGRDS